METEERELALGELAPEVIEMLAQIKLDQRKAEMKDRVEAFEADPENFMVIERGKGSVWNIICPKCTGFAFERVKIGVAREWAHEHNESVHGGTMGIFDRTV